MKEIEVGEYFFVNRSGGRFSEQSLVRMIKRHKTGASIDSDITPRMIRNTVVAQLLEEGADIGYIQKMIGQTYIKTARYNDWSHNKDQQDTLQEKHPRNRINIKNDKAIAKGKLEGLFKDCEDIH